MTAAFADAAGDGDYRGWRKRAMRIGHVTGNIAVYVFPALLGGNIALFWISPNDWIATIAAAAVSTLASAALIAAMLLRGYVHNRGLCLDCLNEAPMLDPQTAVDKKLRLLRLFHNQRRFSLMSWGALGLFLGAVAAHPDLSHAIGALPANLACTGAAAAAIVLNFATDRASKVHRRLYPWCPFCDHGGGGHDNAAAPTPQPAGTIN